MSDQEPFIVLLDTLPFRRAAYANQLSAWAAPNGFAVRECTELKMNACAPALTLIVLGSQRIGSVEGRARIDAAMRISNKPVAVIVDTQSAECINVALDLGLHGVLNVSETPEVLSAALGFIIAGGRYVPHMRASEAAPSEMSYLPQPADTSLTPIQVLGEESFDNPDLTRRQYEVLYGLANGHSNKEIARDLALSEATVKSHVRQVMRKLHVDNRTQAALLARDLLSTPSAQNFYTQTPLT
ncbi:response regulator transcription factor [Sulfitobacter sp. W074]|uniref:helix-turn-helix transcriptional regulator n=1 Tax=Sulfitobacter sp. W074 TaxID=2867026 RepID=UPI002882D929|nr:response regulator transcription factor [Sulfitobacter sp. W074]